VQLQEVPEIDFVPQVLFCLCGILKKEQSCCCHGGVRRWIRNSKLSRTHRYIYICIWIELGTTWVGETAGRGR